MLRFLLPAVITTAFASMLNSSTKDKLSLKGVIEVRHCIKDRLRISVPSLKGNQSVADKLIADLDKLDVVKSSEASSLTGSVIISYDQSQMEPVFMMGILVQLLGLDNNLSAVEKAELEKEFSMMKDSFDRGLLSVTKGKIDTKSTVTTLLIAGIIYSLIKNSHSIRALPTPLTLIWWLYQNNLINKENK